MTQSWGLAKYAFRFTTHFELKFTFCVQLKVRPTRLSGVIVCIGKPVLRKTFRVQVFETFLWQRFASSVASIFGRLLVNASPSLLAMRSQRILMSPSTHSKLVMLFYCYLYCNMSSCIVMFHIFTFGWNIAVSLKHCQGPMYLRVVRIQRISDVNFTTRRTKYSQIYFIPCHIITLLSLLLSGLKPFLQRGYVGRHLHWHQMTSLRMGKSWSQVCWGYYHLSPQKTWLPTRSTWNGWKYMRRSTLVLISGESFENLLPTFCCQHEIWSQSLSGRWRRPAKLLWTLQQQSWGELGGVWAECCASGWFWIFVTWFHVLSQDCLIVRAALDAVATAAWVPAAQQNWAKCWG